MSHSIFVDDNYCANCSCSLAQTRKNQPKIYKLDVLIHLPSCEDGSLVSSENISVISVLKDLFGFGVHFQSSHHRDVILPDSLNTNIDIDNYYSHDVPLCLPCSLILQDLYRSFKLFKSVRKETSYISQKLAPCSGSDSRSDIGLESELTSHISSSNVNRDDICIKTEPMDDEDEYDDPNIDDESLESEIRRTEEIIENSRLGFTSDDNAETTVDSVSHNNSFSQLLESESEQTTQSDFKNDSDEAKGNFGAGMDASGEGCSEINWNRRRSKSRVARIVKIPSCEESDVGTQRDRAIKWHDGYPFTVNRVYPNGNARYVCRRRRGFKCTGALMVYNTGMQALTMHHDPPHPPAFVEKDNDLLRVKLKERALSHPQEKPSEVVKNVLAQFPPSAAAELAQKKSSNNYVMYIRKTYRSKAPTVGHPLQS